MNRIVIIGNGFDLAHGLKTNYEDFLLWYIKRQIKTVCLSQEDVCIDDLISVFANSIHGAKEIDIRLSSIKTIANLYTTDFISYIPLNGVLQEFTDSKPIRLEINSEFFNELMHRENWTDIEGFYFKSVLKLFHKEENANYLNGEFELLEKLLIEYLSIVDKTIPKGRVLKPMATLVDRCFAKPNSDTYERFFSKDFQLYNPLKLEEICFVNFNYTSLLSKYLGFDSQPDHRIYSIHGSLENDDIVFGYGDDSHPIYKDLENSEEESFLKNIKAFYYPSKKDYVDLMNLAESREFEVFVIGHSLGVSDRVLLKMLFELENCRVIRIFHRGDEASHFRKRIALSRHFSDKQKMRRKILEYDPNDKIG